MTLKWRRRVHRHAGWPLVVAGLLSACGGTSAIIAVIEIVTPLGGDWDVSGSTGDKSLDFNINPPENVLFAPDLILQATLRTLSGICGGPPFTDVPLEGSLSNGELALRLPGSTTICLQGRFTDLITLEAGTPGLLGQQYQNGRVDVQMQLGLWVSAGSGEMKLKFKQHDDVTNNTSNIDVAGCDLSGSSSVEFEGEMEGFNTITRAKPTIPELRPTTSGPSLYTQGVFVDGATITLIKTSSNETITFHRVPDTTTACP